MNHVVIGAGIPCLVFLVIYLARGAHANVFMLVATPLAMIACAAWSIVPDMPLLWGDMQTYMRIHGAPWIDIFFWHGRIDAFEQRVDLAPWNFLAMLVMSAGMPAIAWRELNKAESP